MKILIIVTLMISLVGCESFERALVCNKIEDNKLGEVTICEYSETFNHCRCKQLDLDSFTEITKMQPYPMSFCDGLMGFNAETWKEVGPKLRALNRLKEERCK